jgi:5-methylcytosine-specific restriction endonuclease McrA
MTDEQRKKMSLAKLGARNPRFGKPGTCLGRKQTLEQLQKIREARARQVITIEHRRKISESLKRAYAEGRKRRDTSLWYIDGRHQGNRHQGNRKIKTSFEYRVWRESVFKRDNYTCQGCGVRGGELQAHHIKPQSIYPELRFDLANGLTLCRPCHLKTDSFGMRTNLVKRALSAKA